MHQFLPIPSSEQGELRRRSLLRQAELQEYGPHTLLNCRAICVQCHKIKTRGDIQQIRKSDRQRDKSIGVIRPAGKIKSAGFSKTEKALKRQTKPSLPPRRLYEAAAMKLGTRQIELLRTVGTTSALVVLDNVSRRLCALGLMKTMGKDGDSFTCITPNGLRALADAADAGRVELFVMPNVRACGNNVDG